VERAPVGPLGASRAAPLVQGRTSGQDKKPWKTVTPPRGPVEAEFLRPVVLGENLAPFRMLPLALGVIPVLDTGEVMDAARATGEGKRRLADWLTDVEGKWNAHASRDAAGKPKMTLAGNLDHMRKLSQQFPIGEVRVAYAKAGTLFASAIIQDSRAVIDHMAYWATARSMDEARYLLAILNCDHLRRQIAARQSKGQGGARDFDNLIWELPIPEFSARDPLHQELGALTVECEAVAAAVVLQEGAYFTTQRRAIRDALEAAGLTKRLDATVAKLPGL